MSLDILAAIWRDSVIASTFEAWFSKAEMEWIHEDR